jgi:predicted transcriptional regulator
MASGSGTPVLDVPEYLAHLAAGTAPRLKKHTKKKLDGLDKKRICIYHANHSNARQEDIAELFGVERSTVSKILKNKEEWLNVDENAVPSVKYRYVFL